MAAHLTGGYQNAYYPQGRTVADVDEKPKARCCAKCKTPGYGCANGACVCHTKAKGSRP